jgi:cellulose synthase/poly-beta-1,6-N-acetylglucosamine synthase-like glycosyltransferase
VFVLLACYVLLGPLMAGAIVALTYLGRRRMMKLKQRDGEAAGATCVALVPVRDEEDGIAACVESLLSQDFPADRLRFVVIDDRSTDATPQVLATLAAKHPDRLAVRRIDDIPDGWLGKPHALAHGRGTVEADPDWFVFVDSDVKLHPAAVRRTVSLASSRSYDAVSLLTGMETPTLLEMLVGPVVAAVWMTTFRGSETNNDSRRDRAVANGQFLIVRPHVLDAAGGHSAVRDQTCEDVALFRRIKANGGRVRLLLGSHLATTRMHATWRQMFNGWARNFAGTAKHRPLPIVVGLLIVLLHASAVPVLVASLVAVSGPWMVVGLLHVLLVGLWCFVAARSAGLVPQRALLVAALHPVALAATMILMANAIRACLGGTVQWRGSTVRA